MANADLEAEILAAIATAQANVVAAGKAKAADLIAAQYTEDAVVLPPGAAPLHGRAAVRAHFTAAYEQPGDLLDQTSQTTSLEIIRDDLAIEAGRFEGTASGPDGQHRFAGKTLILWRREPDGVWRMDHDMWQVDEAESVDER